MVTPLTNTTIGFAFVPALNYPDFLKSISHSKFLMRWSGISLKNSDFPSKHSLWFKERSISVLKELIHRDKEGKS